MSTASIKETLLQEVSTLPPAYYSEALRLIKSLKTSKIFVSDDFDVPTAETPESTKTVRKRPKLGGWEGKIWIADDFNAPMEEFEEYM